MSEVGSISSRSQALRAAPAASAFLVLAAAARIALAEGFDSGSTGSDGALSFPQDAGTILFDPASFEPGLDPDGDNVYHFTTITVPTGTTVKLRADILGEGRAVVWLASGAVEVAGQIDLNGENGHPAGQPARAALAGAGGFNGGPGGSAGSAGRAGNGPGGGRGGRESAGRVGGAAGHLVPGELFSTVPGGPAYGNRYLLPLLGGSGGGGGSNEAVSSGGGGAGGGAFLLASSVSIDLQGAILARGGAGGQLGISASGGPASGGAVRLMAPLIGGNGRIEAASASQLGSPGRIRIERFVDRFSGTILPANAASFSSPGGVFPPASAPVARIVSVGGNDVVANPLASFVAPDVTIDSAGSLTIEIEAENIPVGTRVRLRIVPEDGDEATVDSTPLAGTLASSTATAEASFTSGFSKIFITASWQP